MRRRQPRSDQSERIQRLTKKLADETIATLEKSAKYSADRGMTRFETSLRDSVRDEATQTSFIVNIASTVADHFRSKGFKVTFRTDHERLDDGAGMNTVLVQKVILSW